jgi:hypothetical protein
MTGDLSTTLAARACLEIEGLFLFVAPQVGSVVEQMRHLNHASCASSAVHGGVACWPCSWSIEERRYLRPSFRRRGIHFLPRRTDTIK